jgi:hypothetical protein
MRQLYSTLQVRSYGNDAGPFEEGKIAAAEGGRRSSNPYGKDTDEFDLWRQGFKSDDVVEPDAEEFEE